MTLPIIQVLLLREKLDSSQKQQVKAINNIKDNQALEDQEVEAKAKIKIYWHKLNKTVIRKQNNLTRLIKDKIILKPN